MRLAPLQNSRRPIRCWKANEQWFLWKFENHRKFWTTYQQIAKPITHFSFVARSWCSRGSPSNDAIPRRKKLWSAPRENIRSIARYWPGQDQSDRHTPMESRTYAKMQQKLHSTWLINIPRFFVKQKAEAAAWCQACKWRLQCFRLLLRACEYLYIALIGLIGLNCLLNTLDSVR